MSMPASDKATNVVLVHGAWANGSSWAQVIKPLHAMVLTVLAAPIPLTSLHEDIAVLERALERTDGPIVLVAHACAGAVLAACRNERVRSLVFIAALTPDEGETVGEVFYREKPHPEAPQLASDRDGFIWMPIDRFGTAFAQHAQPADAPLLAAKQRPIALQCIQEKSPPPTWKTKPSWYLVAQEDRMINPATQLFLAQWMGARTRSDGVEPYATGHCAAIGGQNNRRGRNQLSGKSEFLRAPDATSSSGLDGEKHANTLTPKSKIGFPTRSKIPSEVGSRCRNMRAVVVKRRLFTRAHQGADAC